MRLIDADALLKKLNEEKIPFNSDINSFIISAATVDAVEVVRCKDCKWFGEIGCSIMVVDETDMPKEKDFCSFGERKDNETD